MVQLLMIDPESLKSRKSSFAVRISIVGEPKNSCFDEQVMTFTKQILPENERALGHACVDLVWSIAHANHSGLAARARSTISWSICVQQQHRRAVLTQFVRGPGAEHSGSYNNNV